MILTKFFFNYFVKSSMFRHLFFFPYMHKEEKSFLMFAFRFVRVVNEWIVSIIFLLINVDALCC